MNVRLCRLKMQKRTWWKEFLSSHTSTRTSILRHGPENSHDWEYRYIEVCVDKPKSKRYCSMENCASAHAYIWRPPSRKTSARCALHPGWQKQDHSRINTNPLSSVRIHTSDISLYPIQVKWLLLPRNFTYSAKTSASLAACLSYL